MVAYDYDNVYDTTLLDFEGEILFEVGYDALPIIYISSRLTYDGERASPTGLGTPPRKTSARTAVPKAKGR